MGLTDYSITVTFLANISCKEILTVEGKTSFRKKDECCCVKCCLRKQIQFQFKGMLFGKSKHQVQVLSERKTDVCSNTSPKQKPKVFFNLSRKRKNNVESNAYSKGKAIPCKIALQEEKSVVLKVKTDFKSSWKEKTMQSLMHLWKKERLSVRPPLAKKDCCVQGQHYFKGFLQKKKLTQSPMYLQNKKQSCARSLLK